MGETGRGKLCMLWLFRTGIGEPAACLHTWLCV